MLSLQSVFTMVLIVSANFLAETFPCRVQYLLKNNMIAKHIFGLLTMVFFVVLAVSDTSQDYFHHIFIEGILLYLVFILMTKTSTGFFFAIMLLLAVIYLLHLYDKKQDTNQMIDEKQKSSSSRSSSRSSRISKVSDILYYLTYILLGIGVLTYIGEKKIEYGKRFSYIYFFLGKPTCKGSSPSVGFLRAMNAIVS